MAEPGTQVHTQPITPWAPTPSLIWSPSGVSGSPQGGSSSAPGSFIMSADESHKGKSVTIHLCQGIRGWLAPPPMADGHAAPQTQTSVCPEAGGPPDSWLSSAGTGNPQTRKQHALMSSQYNPQNTSDKTIVISQHSNIYWLLFCTRPCAKHFQSLNCHKNPVIEDNRETQQ